MSLQDPTNGLHAKLGLLCELLEERGQAGILCAVSRGKDLLPLPLFQVKQLPQGWAKRLGRGNAPGGREDGFAGEEKMYGLQLPELICVAFRQGAKLTGDHPLCPPSKGEIGRPQLSAVLHPFQQKRREGE